MPFVVNLRHLEAHPVRLEGELSVAELDIDTHDEVIQVARPLEYDITVQKLQGGLLAEGRLRLVLDCRCVRCLKAFEREVALPAWTCHIPLEGEEAARVVSDCVDLTAIVREDILLEFPQHPLCNAECGGLPQAPAGSRLKPGNEHSVAGASAWTELNKLKF
ncbi:conserved hypothetical protein [Verrucomicrobia bacterium]|nr:conserved hypothetical protein [Verrucomicrobiota bacterium]